MILTKIARIESDRISVTVYDLHKDLYMVKKYIRTSYINLFINAIAAFIKENKTYSSNI